MQVSKHNFSHSRQMGYFEIKNKIVTAVKEICISLHLFSIKIITVLNWVFTLIFKLIFNKYHNRIELSVHFLNQFSINIITILYLPSCLIIWLIFWRLISVKKWTFVFHVQIVYLIILSTVVPFHCEIASYDSR